MNEKTKPIPKSVLAALGASVWKHEQHDLDKFQRLVEIHAHGDARHGCTSVYHLSDKRGENDFLESISGAELQAMIRDGATPEWAHTPKGTGVNQHWLHSLEQFFAECTVAWQKHQERTDALRGTPAGRTGRSSTD